MPKKVSGMLYFPVDLYYEKVICFHDIYTAPIFPSDS